MRPGPHALAAYIQQTFDIRSAPKPISEVCVSVCIDLGWHTNSSDAAEAVETWEKDVQTKLRRDLSDLNQMGRPASFAFNSSSDYMIQGAGYVEPRDPEPIREAKNRRATVGSYAAAAEALSPKQFERLCAGIADLLGVRDAKVTAYSADEGVDFYGRLHLDETSAFVPAIPTVERQMRVWVIGQAKHYQAGKLSTPDLRDLVGAVVLARGNAYGAVGSRYPDLEIRPCDPVFYFVITTGRMSTNSWRLIDRSGVVGMDGEMVAAFLADRQVAVDAGGLLDRQAFIDWVDGYSAEL